MRFSLSRQELLAEKRRHLDELVVFRVFQRVLREALISVIESLLDSLERTVKTFQTAMG